MNAEFQRIAKRDAKAFLSNLFKKIRDTKGTFHAKMGLIKDRNGMDLTEAEDIKFFGPFFDWVVYFSGIELLKLLVYF